MGVAIDPFILENAPGPVVDVDAGLIRTRAAFNDLLTTVGRLDDASLGHAWTWDGNAVDIRYSFYRAFEMIEGATSAANRALAGAPSSEARDAVTAATASRWQLHGVLATLDEADLDADPGNDEWTIRRTMGHIINSQRGYAWGSAWWLSVRDEPRFEGPQRAPEDAFPSGFPEEEDEPTGTLAEVRAKLDEIVDATSARYTTLTDDDMLVKSGWSGFPVTIGFRQWRWSSHIAEHTVQIEKTIDMLGRRRSEVDWLVRLIAAAYGRLEATVFGRESAAGASNVLTSVATDLEGMSPSVGAAIRAGVAAPDW
jgi:hypothetical protein